MHPWEIRREAMLDMLGKARPFAMTAVLQINQGEARLLVEALSGRWNFERDRRDQRGVWHYVANVFSMCVDRIAPGAPPLRSPPVVHTWFNPLAMVASPDSMSSWTAISGSNLFDGFELLAFKLTNFSGWFHGVSSCWLRRTLDVLRVPNLAS